MMTRSKANNTMASILVVMAVVVVILPGAKAQSPMLAPGPMTEPMEPMGPVSSPDCLTALLNMSDCLTYVETGSNLTKPDTGCCPELAGLVESNPICLCELLADPGKTGIQIDIKKALKLPTVCSVDTPSVSLCAAIGIPVGAPTASDGPSPSSSTTLSGDMAPGGSAVSPTSPSDSSGSTTRLHIFVGLAVIISQVFF